MSKFLWQQWWWVLVVCFGGGALYFHCIEQKNKAVSELSFRLQEMEREKLDALDQRESLRLQIVSQNDPSWVEMVLMRDLGVVPEGWLKVHFKHQ